MVKLSSHATFKGAAFSPFRAEQDTRLRFSEMTEPDGTTFRGIHRRSDPAVGSARLDPPHGTPGEPGLDWLLSQLTVYVPTLRLHGATEIILHLQVDHSGPTCFELPSTQLGRLAALGVPLVIDCRSTAPAGRW